MADISETQPTRRRWSLVVVLLVISAGALFPALKSIRSKVPKTEKLDGKLNVLVRPPDRTVEPVSVDQAGALPVQSGGAMCLDVHLNQPAFVYLVWIDSAGQLIPLYPWNNETLEIKDIDQPPPERRPGKLIFSPLLGKSWAFGPEPGSEMVLLLARREPLPKDFQLGRLVKELPQSPKLEAPNNLAILQAGGTSRSDSTTPAKVAGSPNAALAEFIQPLTEHFELVQAVQFAHSAAGGENVPPDR